MDVINTENHPILLEKKIRQFKSDPVRKEIFNKLSSLLLIAPKIIRVKLGSEINDLVTTETDESFSPLFNHYKKILKDYDEVHYSDILNLTTKTIGN